MLRQIDLAFKRYRCPKCHLVLNKSKIEKKHFCKNSDCPEEKFYTALELQQIWGKKF